MKTRPAVAFVLVTAVACGSADSRKQNPGEDPVLRGAGQTMPADLEALVARAKLEGEVAAWCRAEFQPGQRESYAVAVGTGPVGRYLAVDRDGRATTLSAFNGRPDLSCYSRTDAEQLNRSIGQSETIQGEITPRGNTTVVCGFTHDTTAQCWQYSPTDRTFVKVGEWTT